MLHFRNCLQRGTFYSYTSSAFHSLYFCKVTWVFFYTSTVLECVFFCPPLGGEKKIQHDIDIEIVLKLHELKKKKPINSYLFLRFRRFSSISQ